MSLDENTFDSDGEFERIKLRSMDRTINTATGLAFVSGIFAAGLLAIYGTSKLVNYITTNTQIPEYLSRLFE